MEKRRSREGCVDVDQGRRLAVRPDSMAQTRDASEPELQPERDLIGFGQTRAQFAGEAAEPAVLERRPSDEFMS